jgi:hypothetical protein
VSYDQFEARALQRWFEVTGATKHDLIAEIDRLQPGDDPADGIGLHATIALKIAEHPHPFTDDARIAIHRAMQTIAIQRVNQRTAKKAARQLDLFDGSLR